MYKDRRVVAVILARARSTRLPGKMMMPFGDSTVVGEAIERIKRCTLVDELVFATSTHPDDDALADLAAAHALRCVRGSEADVVGRMIQSLPNSSGGREVVVRVCCDNPLVMPSLVDDAVRDLVDADADVITPAEFASLPFGMSMVVMTREALERIDAEADAPMYREHVENYCFDHPEAFQVLYQWAPEGLECRELSLTLDHAVDYARLSYWRERLADVAIEDQAQVLVEEALSARAVLIVDSSVDIDDFSGVLDDQDTVLAIDAWGKVTAASVPDVKGRLAVDWLRTHRADLVISTTDHVPLVQPRLGWLELCVAEGSDGLRRGLRYAAPRPDAFSEEPIITDWQSNTLREGRLPYLLRILPVVLKELKTGPMRGWSHQERFFPPTTKRASNSARVGYKSAISVLFPDEVVVEVSDIGAGALDGAFGSPKDIAALAEEMSAFPHAVLCLETNTESMPVAVARMRVTAEKYLPRARVIVRAHTPIRDDGADAAFRVLRVSAMGALAVPGLAVAAARGWESIGAFWRAPAVRKARVQMLNARALNETKSASAA